MHDKLNLHFGIELNIAAIKLAQIHVFLPECFFLVIDDRLACVHFNGNTV